MRTLSRRYMVAVSTVIVAGTMLSSAGLGQEAKSEGPKPNYSGTWKLDIDRSSFGAGIKPKSQTEVIQQSAGSLSLAFISRTETVDMHYRVDLTIGADPVGISQNLFRPDDFLKVQDAKAEWQDDVLMVTLNATFKDDSATIKSKYTLSPDGKTLTKVTNIDRDSGPVDMTEVYVKA